MRDQFPAPERAAMLDEARRLARLAFKRPGRAHILAIYERIVWNRQRGLETADAATVH